jgi:hypothetical protein
MHGFEKEKSGGMLYCVHASANAYTMRILNSNVIDVLNARQVGT